ncbi:MAG: methyl-accepting chemotaxis protein [Pseudomonadales bacterium]|nr:methyl-accepting chemotaxis protein [Pseudomonadales bacterium]NRA14767.1 hypothetical protein [Oceanospirillaceae bacterium]
MPAFISLFNRFSIRVLILGNSLLLLTLLVLCSSYAVYSMTQIGKELDGIANQDIPLTASITAITEHQLEQTIHLERALRFSQQAEAGNSHAVDALKAEIDAFDQLSLKVNQEIRDSEEQAKNAINQAHNKIEEKEFRHVLQVLESIDVLHSEFEQHSHKAFTLIKQHLTAEAEIMMVTVEQEADQLTKELEELLHEIGKFTEDAAHQAQLHEQSGLKTLSIIVIISIGIGLLMSYAIIRSIWSQIGLEPKAMNTLSQRIADGDLSMQLPDTGRELGVYASMTKMVSNLKRLIEDIQRGAEHVSESSQNLARVTEQTNINLVSQTQSTQQVATAITEMVAAVDEVARNTSTAADSALSAKNQLSQGSLLVDDTVNGIKQLSQQLNNTMTVISRLELETRDINSILDVIKGIADQTNLLALNAAIEAARAGEQGRGFAVVADEVRSLAKSTQESASEIEQMISRLQSSANSSIQAMQEGSEQSSKLLSQSEKVTRALDQVQQTVSDISDMNMQIALAAKEQKEVSAHISENITGISSMSKENGDGSQLLSATSEELAVLATQLLGRTEQFKVNP